MQWGGGEKLQGKGGGVKLNRREVLRGGLSAFGFLALPDGLFAAPDGWKPTGKPDLVFGTLSDTHLQVNYNGVSPHGRFPIRYLRKALEYYKSRNIDALVHCGDMAHRGMVRELEFHQELIDEVFGKGKGPVKLFVAGNHEWFGDGEGFGGVCGRRLYPDPVERVKHTICGDFPRHWERAFGEPYEACWHKEVKGYHFFGHHWNVNETAFLDFVKNHAASSPLGGAKPFFMLSHTYLHHRFCRLLSKDFPNAVSFFGHFHQSNADWRTIYFDALGGFFPRIELGPCRADGGLDLYGNLGRTGESSFLKDRDGAAEIAKHTGRPSRQGMIVNVYDDMVVFERHEFTEGGKLGPDWIMPLGKYAPHPFSMEELKKVIGEPQFKDGAKLEVSLDRIDKINKIEKTANDNPVNPVQANSASPQLRVRIPLADGNPDSRVFVYEVEVVGDASEKILCKSVYAIGRDLGIGHEPNGGVTTLEIPKSELPEGNKLTIAVRPLSSLGTAGQAIATTWRA